MAQTGRYISRDEYDRQYRDLNQQLYNQRSQKSPTGSTAARDASVRDMVALIQQLFPGAIVTSPTRGRPTNGSDHYAGRALDFPPQVGPAHPSPAAVPMVY